MAPVKVRAVVITAGGPSSFLLEPGTDPGEIMYSMSLLVQSSLVAAFLAGVPVELERVPDSQIVQRVLPFAKRDSQKPNSTGEHRVSRIATQRKPDGTDEHLEVFLVKGKDEKVYNVYDSFLQQVLIASFSESPDTNQIIPMDVYFAGDSIVTIRLGSS